MRTSKVELRAAGAEDAAAVAALHAESWRRFYRGAYADAYLDGDVEQERQAVWTERLLVPDEKTATIGAWYAKELIGFAHVLYDEDALWGSLLENLHVTERRQGNGVGGMLLGAVATWISEQPGSDRLYLWVLDQNTDAQRFYRSHGGAESETGVTPPPGDVAERLVGTPLRLRYAWQDVSVLLPG